MASSANKKDTINLGLCGAAGRMGREILSEAMLYPNIHVAKAYEIPGHRLLGRSLGTAALEPDTAPSFLEGCEVLVDFSTTAEAILTHLQRATISLI